MAIPNEAFIPLEGAITDAVMEAVWPRVEALAKAVAKELSQGEYSNALERVHGFSLQGVLPPKGRLMELSHACLMFGATRIVEEDSAHLVDFAHELPKVEVALRNLAFQVDNTLAAQVRGMLAQAIRASQRGDQPTLTAKMESCGCHSCKADVLGDFVSFSTDGLKSVTQTMAQTLSSLHTSRLSSLGFAAEAEYLGITEYGIDERMDSRTCPVCSVMHGRTFTVESLRRSVDAVLSVDNPEDLRELQKWPRQDEASVKALAKASAAELAASNLNMPPYHPNCRGLTVTIADISGHQATPTYQQALGINPEIGKYKPSKWDFIAVGIEPTDAALVAWGDAFTQSPRKILSMLMGVDENLITEDFLAKAGVSAEMDGGVLSVKGRIKLEGMSSAAPVSIDFDTKTKTLHLNKLSTKTGKDFKAAFKQVLEASKGWGATTLTTTAKTPKWGYYGFLPQDWQALKARLTSRLQGLRDLVDAEVFASAETLLASDDPRAFWVLLEIDSPIEAKSFAEKLVGRVPWAAKLDLADPLAAEKAGFFFD
jgi:hypothetical protein